MVKFTRKKTLTTEASLITEMAGDDDLSVEDQ